MTIDPTLALTLLAQRSGRAAEHAGSALVGPPTPSSLRTPSAGLWPPQGAQILAFTLIAAGAFLVIWVLWKRRMEARMPLESPPPPETGSPSLVGQVAETQRLFHLMGEAEDLARRFSQRLDEKSERLQHLIQAADERLARLERIEPAAPIGYQQFPPMPQRSSATAPFASDTHTPPTQPSPPLTPLTPAPRPMPEVFTRPSRAPSPQPVGSAPSRSTAPAPRPAVNTMHSIDPLTAEIYRLSDDGLPVIEIAKQLGQHTGKVELILALRQT